MTKCAFDLVFAFDETVSFGYRESVTVSQIKTYMDMDSHEERLHLMIQQQKINEAKEVGKKKQRELLQSRLKEKLEAAKSGTGVHKDEDSVSLEEQLSKLRSEERSQPAWAAALDDSEPAPVAAMPKRGLSLGKKPAQASELLSAAFGKKPAAALKVEEPPEVINPLLEPVKVAIDETVKAVLLSEGGIRGEVEIVGQFVVTVLDPKAELVAFRLTPMDRAYKVKVHPNLNKAMHSENRLEIRDPARGYPERPCAAAEVAPRYAGRARSAPLPLLLAVRNSRRLHSRGRVRADRGGCTPGCDLPHTRA